MLVFSKLKGTKSLRFQIKQIIVSVLLFLPTERSFCRALLAVGSHLKRGICAFILPPMKILILEILVECYICIFMFSKRLDCITCYHALERKRKGIEIECRFGRVRSCSMHVSFTAETRVYQTVLDSPMSRFVSEFLRLKKLMDEMKFCMWETLSLSSRVYFCNIFNHLWLLIKG